MFILFTLFLMVFCVISGHNIAFGNVFNSPHDLYSQGYLLLSDDEAQNSPQCSLCHPVPTDERPMIWDVLPESMEEIGPVGNICASCHDGVSIVDVNVDAGLTVFHPASHGLDPDSSPEKTNLAKTGLPYTGGKMMSCSTCHDPHLQKSRPFLRVSLSGLCERCHQERSHLGYGINNVTGTHPVNIDPFDNTGDASPIEIQEEFKTPFPGNYPLRDGILRKGVHWQLGGHLSFGNYGKIECSTCHAFHGVEGSGPNEALLASDPESTVANRFCEGCHRGQRGDDNSQPPFPNPGGTTVGRTYHPVDNDESNGVGWNVAIADTTDLQNYQWGAVDEETKLPFILCTTCHQAHNGLEYSPALVEVNEDVKAQGVTTFCEICHWEPPPGHHGYGEGGFIPPNIAAQINSNRGDMGVTFGEPDSNRIYCSHCHKAHNAGYGDFEEKYVPILVGSGIDICSNCHSLGVSHFMGDPTLPSTYNNPTPPLYREIWPTTGLPSRYDGEGEIPTTITCVSCHYLSDPSEEYDAVPGRLLASADENSVWYPDTQDHYLCTGCHGIAPEKDGRGGHSHPLMTANRESFPSIITTHLLPDELPASFTETGEMNCHSCHSTHNAATRGGVYILKVVRGENVDPKSIHPKIDFTTLCHSCHPADAY
jgi:predicted CXXCH cytochrome family protein